MIYDRRDHAADSHRKAIDDMYAAKEEARKSSATIKELQAKLAELEKAFARPRAK